MPENKTHRPNDFHIIWNKRSAIRYIVVIDHSPVSWKNLYLASSYTFEKLIVTTLKSVSHSKDASDSIITLIPNRG